MRKYRASGLYGSSKEEKTGFSFLQCQFLNADNFEKLVFGRDKHETTIAMISYVLPVSKGFEFILYFTIQNVIPSPPCSFLIGAPVKTLRYL